MTGTINGIGTVLYGYGAAVRWQKRGLLKPVGKADHDTVECAVFLYLPLFPLRGFHTWDWPTVGSEHKELQIRPPGHLTVRAMVRVWLGLSLPLTIILGLPVIVDLIRYGSLVGSGEMFLWLCGSSVVFLICFFGLLFAMPGNRRDRDIRLILGPHQLGSSDPATWMENTLNYIRPASELFGISDVVDGARKALQEKKYALAMFGARLAVARGKLQGEDLTDEILTLPDLREKLPKFRRKPWLREELLGNDSLPPYLKQESGMPWTS